MEPNLELKMMQDLRKISLPAINYDWFCQTYNCKMLRSACERRQELAKYTGVNKSRAQYSFTCGQCKQVEGESKMITEEEVFTIGPTEAENQKNETTRTCRNCREMLPMESFMKNNECANGYEWTCKKCRAEKKRLADAIRKIDARRKNDGMTPPMRKSPPKLPIGLPPGVSIPVENDDFPLTKDFICDYDHSVTLDFSYHPELLKSTLDAAKREFRTPQMQVLYMLSKYVD
jgi:hypothetical protein